MRNFLLIVLPFLLVTACTAAPATVLTQPPPEIPTAVMETTKLPAPSSTPIAATPVITIQETEKSVVDPVNTEYTSGTLKLILISTQRW